MILLPGDESVYCFCEARTNGRLVRFRKTERKKERREGKKERQRE
jgi:hypothetical protein